jgi:hypothetical protein
MMTLPRKAASSAAGGRGAAADRSVYVGNVRQIEAVRARAKATAIPFRYMGTS